MSRACSARSATARATSGRWSSSTPSATWTRATCASGSSSISCATAASVARSGSTWPAGTWTTTSSCSCRRASSGSGTSTCCSASRRTPSRRRSPRRRRGPRGSGRPAPLDALPLSRLYASVTPAPVQRLEAVRLNDWERQGRDWRVPRSSLAPILRFADVDAFVQESEDGGKDGTQLDGIVQVGVAKEDQPHYLKVMARPEADGRAAHPLRARRDRGARRRLDAPPPGRPGARPHLRIAASTAGSKRRALPRSRPSRC